MFLNLHQSEAGGPINLGIIRQPHVKGPIGQGSDQLFQIIIDDTLKGLRSNYEKCFSQPVPFQEEINFVQLIS